MIYKIVNWKTFQESSAMDNKKNRILWWSALAIFLFVCSYFVVYNAQWLIGDDAIVIKHIGFGHYFKTSDTVQPEIGRFFPFTYLMYNVLPLFTIGNISATTVYSYQALILILFAIIGFLLTLGILKERPAFWRYSIAFLVTVFLVGRHYSEYINCFSTSWFGSFVNIVSVAFLYLYHKKGVIIYAVLAFIAFTYCSYCSEVNFVVPLTIGVGALALLWRRLSMKSKFFYGSLILSSVLFLAIYYFKVYVHTTSAYDGSHGAEVTFLGNAFHILLAQKFIWLIIFVALCRIYEIAKYKKEFTIYDIMILAAAGHCVGGFILKLNWILYYNRAIIIALPSVIYYLNIWLKPHYLCAVSLCFAAFYGIKIPKAITTSQENRTDAYCFVKQLIDCNETQNKDIIFYYPEDETDDFNSVLRDWIYSSLQTYIAYELNQEDLYIERISSLSDIDTYENCIIVTSSYNDQLTSSGNAVLDEKYIPIFSTCSKDLIVYKPIE